MTWLAALALLAALVSAGHVHPPHAAGAAMRAAPLDALREAQDLGCALCSSGARLGHGARAALLSAPERTASAAVSATLACAAPARPDLRAADPRAPPRLG